MKKFLPVLEFIIGGFLCLAVLSDIPKVIGAFASRNVAYALGSLVGTFVLGYLAYWLIKHGGKNWKAVG